MTDISMTPEEIKNLIRFHRKTLAEYRMFVNISTQTLEEQTIKALEELLKIKEGG